MAAGSPRLPFRILNTVLDRSLLQVRLALGGDFRGDGRAVEAGLRGSLRHVALRIERVADFNKALTNRGLQMARADLRPAGRLTLVVQRRLLSLCVQNREPSSRRNRSAS